MSNTLKIQGKMREKGETLESLSKSIGISKTSLFNKIHNTTEFLVSEIQAIRKALDLSEADVQEYFFAI